MTILKELRVTYFSKRTFWGDYYKTIYTPDYVREKDGKFTVFIRTKNRLLKIDHGPYFLKMNPKQIITAQEVWCHFPGPDPDFMGHATVSKEGISWDPGEVDTRDTPEYVNGIHVYFDENGKRRKDK